MRSFNKIFTIIVIGFAVMTATAQTSAIWDGTADTTWYTDNKSVTEFTITTAEQLAGLALLVNGSPNNGRYNMRNQTINLGNDIMLNDTTDWQNWKDTPPDNHWAAIGEGTTQFRGIFNGSGFTVNGVYIGSNNNNQGLFGSIGNNGVIENLGIVASYVRGSSYVGGLAGHNVGAITDCYVIGNIIGTETGGSYIGGLVGWNNGVITNSYAVGNVLRMGYGGLTGGLVGGNSGIITNSHATGNVTGHFSVGGLVGELMGGNSIINSYATGNVIGRFDVGGLVGGGAGIITNSYATGNVEGDEEVGGLVGRRGGLEITNSFYNSETSGQSDNDGRGTPKTTTEMQSEDFVALLNLHARNLEMNKWVWAEGKYPTLSQERFMFQRFTITATAGTGGTISPSGDVIVREGLSETFTFNSYERRLVKDVLVNGKSVGVVSCYTFENMSNDATIEVIFGHEAIVEWENTGFIYDGSQQMPSATATTICGRYVEIIVSRQKIDDSTWTARASLKEENDDIVLNNTSVEFMIFPRNVYVHWDYLQFTYDGEEKTPTATTCDEIFSLGAVSGGAQTNAGTYDVSVDLEIPNPDNIILHNAQSQFTIAPRNVDVIWSNLSFTYDGEEKTPTAVSADDDYPITAVSGGNQINAGTYGVSVSLKTPRGNNVVITNPTTTFTINQRNIYVNWDNLQFTYDGEEKTPTAVSADDDYPITTVRGGNQINAGTYTASVNLQDSTNTNLVLQNATKQFTINRAQGHGSVTLAGWRAASQPNAPVVFSETNGTNGVRFTYRSASDDSYPETPARPANPGLYIVKAIFPEVQNYNSFYVESEFTISNRDAEPLEVVWTGQTEFVYNKMVQVPIPSAKNSNGEGIPLIVLNGQSAAGEYAGALAAMAIIRDEWARQFYYLPNNTIDYTITRRPLNVVMRDQNGNRRDTITTDENIRTSGELFDYIESILGFSNFATDTINKQTDDESVLRGSPRIGIQNDNSQRSLRNNDIILDRNIILSIGERFLVTVMTDSITANNYRVLGRNIAITIDEGFITLSTDPRDNITPIANVRRTDNRYGIRFAINPVSDKAEISVVLPNNERAVEAKIVVYDMTGNVVHSGATTASATGLLWDLRNTAGRFVANGTYLVIAEVKTRNGEIYRYSAKLGVRR